MKRLMILGASRGQVGLYEACKKLGIYSIAASIEGDYPGFALADEICIVDICDKDAVLQKAKALEIDGIVTCCMDTGLQTVGYVASELKLPGLSAQAALDCGDKLCMKRRLVQEGVPTAPFVEIHKESDLETIASLGLPVVIKSCASQGSSGVVVAYDADQAYQAAQSMLSQEGLCIAEQFLSGEEFGAQACVNNGEIVFVMPHGDITYTLQAPIPVGHFVPLDADQRVVDDAVVVSEQAIRALDLDNCAVNIDIMNTEQGCMILELTGRAGANTLPELVSAAYGVDYYEKIALIAVGETIDKEQFDLKDLTALGKMEYVLEDGVLEEFDPVKLNNSVANLRTFVKPGSAVHAFSSLHDCVGQIVVTGDSLNTCKALEQAQFEQSFKIAYA